jgi:hypothetical protein
LKVGFQNTSNTKANRNNSVSNVGKSSPSLIESFLDFLVGLVLTESIDRPDGCWQPTDDSDLQDQTNNSSNGPTNRKKGKPRENHCNEKSHGLFCPKKSLVFEHHDHDVGKPSTLQFPKRPVADRLMLRICPMLDAPAV